MKQTPDGIEIMQQFDYAAPETVEDAIALLQQFGSRARLLAGGTDLIPQMAVGQRTVDLVIDAKKIPTLMEMRFDPTGGLFLGAAVPCYRIYEDTVVAKHYAGLADAASIIGGTAIQSRASVGGNLCNSGPAADSIPALIAYGAKAVIAGSAGQQEVPIEEFCIAPGRNMLAGNELLVGIRIPAPGAASGGRYLRFIPRNEMDIAEVGVGVCIAVDSSNGKILSARVALAAVGPTPIYAQDVSTWLTGKSATESTFQEAGRLASNAATPINDMRGTISHRLRLVEVLTRRALTDAHNRVKQ